MTKPEAADTTLMAELKGWGGPAEMSAFEAIMWRVEADPMLRSTGTLVLQLDSCPDWPRLVAAHEWLVRVVPRFRQRVVDPAYGIGSPTWIDDPEFILDYHLRRVRLPEPGTHRQLLDLVQTIAMSPFDKARAPWESTLVEGLEDGSAAYVLKMHHSTTDGLGIMQLFSRVLSTTPETSGREPPPLPSVPRKAVPRPGELARKNLATSLKALPGGWAKVNGSLLSKARDWISDPAKLRESLDYAASAKRVLSVKPIKGSPLLRKRSLTWRFDSLDFALTDLKSAAKSADATLNDALLAGLMGGFRRYHEQMGVSTPDRMPVGFPVSIRTEADAIGGNRFAGAQYAALINEKDPVMRMRDVQAFVRNIKSEPGLDSLVRVMPVLTRLPLAVATTLTSNMTTAQDAQISNVPGINRTVYIAGARVTHMIPFGPLPGCAMMIAMITHDGRCCLGVNSDRAAVTEPELMMQCIQEGIDEVLDLVPRKKAPPVAAPSAAPAAAPAAKPVAKAPVKKTTTRKAKAGAN